jgi:3-deoxy-D-manno-octulosonic-acid transferase
MNPFARLAYEIAFHGADLLSSVVPPGGSKVQRSIAARRGAISRIEAWSRSKRRDSAPLLWMHAASVGEGLMAKPVIEILRSRHPSLQLAYTFYSPSAEPLARSLPVDVADYLPFDTTSAAETMLAALRPKAIAFSKVDVWPLLAETATRSGVSTLLTSASLAASSGRTSPFSAPLLHDAYAGLSAAGAAHSDDRDRLIALGVRADRISVTGDTRYDQVWARARGPLPSSAIVDRLRSDRPTLVAGSTWPTDNQVLLAAWTKVRESAPRARLVLADHEPTEGTMTALRDFAASSGATVAPLETAGAETDIIVVDRMGVLADLYALATVAYVGGGFHSAGLHSVVEPAAHGAPVLFGPRHTASRDAVALAAAGGGFAVADSQSMSGQLIRLFTSAPERSAAGERARGVVAAGLGAAERTAALVERFL